MDFGQDIRSTCGQCQTRCGIVVRLVDNKLVQIRRDPA